MTGPDGHGDEPDIPARGPSGNLEPGDDPTTDDNDDPGWPWSFLLLVAAGALYLIFRFIELGIKLFN